MKIFRYITSNATVPFLLGTLCLSLVLPAPSTAAERASEAAFFYKPASIDKLKIKIFDKEGPLIGVNVRVKGSSDGTITDLDGTAVLKNISSHAILQISYVGYVTQEVKVNGKSSIEVELVENTTSLDEVVVVGYGTLEKKQVTSSVTSISGDELTLGVGGSDISTAMQGKIGGLVMVNNGSANASTTFQLRGMTSVNAGASPLIVIDGFPGGDIRSLNQEDIKSIDVLKDASAGAIYGTRAASGVILITTKSGSNTNGKVKISYDAGFSQKQDYRKPKMLTADEYRAHNIGKDYGADIDWWDELINHHNFSQKHHLSASAGTEKAQFYTSFYYNSNEGIAKEDSRIDYGGRVNANFRLFDGWLELRPSVDYRQADRDNNFPNFQQALRNNPTRSPYDPNSQTGYNIWLNETLDYNVLADAMLSTYQGVDKWFKPEITAKLNIMSVPGLSFTQVLGYENRQWELHQYRSRYHRDEQNNSRKGYAKMSFDKTENITSEGYLSYIREFNMVHNVNAVAGYSYFERNHDNFYAENYDFPVDGVGFWDLGKGSYLSDGKAGMGSSKDITEKLFSAFFRINYSYDDRYMATFSLRHEGSSKFAVDNRWANFWAISAGWRLSKESFMRNVKWIDDLKLRFGYGVTGNNDFSSSYMADMLGSDQYWMLPDGQWAYTYGKSQNVNPNLGWEEKKEWNVGLDFSLFKGRLYGKFDYYRRKIDNLIYQVKVPQPPYVNDTQWQNVGSMESKGWELELGGDVIRSTNFTWTSSINLSHNSGKILTLWGNNTYYDGPGFPSPGDPGSATRMAEGSTIGSFYIWKFAGFDENGNFLLYNKDGEVIPADKKTENDKRFMGNYIPKVMVGWTNTLVYKKWDFGMNIRSWIKFDVMNTTAMYFGIQGIDNCNVLADAYGKYNHIRGEKQICDYYLEDGTFLKIDAMTLGYTVPLHKLSKWISKCRLYATVGNVATFTKYSGINPEINITGWNTGLDEFWNIYPQVRTYTLGLQVSF